MGAPQGSTKGSVRVLETPTRRRVCVRTSRRIRPVLKEALSIFTILLELAPEVEPNQFYTGVLCPECAGSLPSERTGHQPPYFD